MFSITKDKIISFLNQNGFDINNTKNINILNSIWEASDKTDELGNEGADEKLNFYEKGRFLTLFVKAFEDFGKKLRKLFNNKDDAGNYENYNSVAYGGDTIKKTYEIENTFVAEDVSLDEDGNIKCIYKTILDSKKNIEYFYEDRTLLRTIDHNNKIEIYYYKNNPETIQAIIKDGISETYYDADGNITKYKDCRNGEIFTYDSQGRILKKFYRQDNLDIEERYDKEGNLKGKLVTKGIATPVHRTFYKKDNDGEIKPYMVIFYDENGVVRDFEKNSDVLGNDFDESLLNGEFDAEFTQGASGICYIATPIQSYLKTPKGKKIMNDCVSYNKETQIGMARLPGYNEVYNFTKEEISKSMTRLGIGDPDFTLFVMGFEAHRKAEERKLDGGHANEFYYATVGKEGEIARTINEEVMDRIDEVIFNENGVVNFGTLNIPQEAKDKGLIPSHEYYVLDKTDDYYIITDNSIKKEIMLTKEECIEYFSEANYIIL